jgi:hypothetical protein
MKEISAGFVTVGDFNGMIYLEACLRSYYQLLAKNIP